MEEIRWEWNHLSRSDDAELCQMSLEETGRARAFHQTFSQYRVTPLADLKLLARSWGLGRIYVKDESYRFGLNAFKVLGGSYAMGRYLAALMQNPKYDGWKQSPGLDETSRVLLFSTEGIRIPGDTEKLCGGWCECGSSPC